MTNVGHVANLLKFKVSKMNNIAVVCKANVNVFLRDRQGIVAACSEVVRRYTITKLSASLQIMRSLNAINARVSDNLRALIYARSGDTCVTITDRS